MFVRVDASSPTPLFEQLAEQLRGQILGGAVKSGQRLPAARELAAGLDINLHTVLRAYQQLRDDGLLELRRGRGAIVTALGRNRGALRQLIPAVVAEARRLGIEPGLLNAMIREEYSDERK